MGFGVGGCPQYGAEATRIMKSQQLFLVQFNVHMVVLDCRLVGIYNPEPSGHTEMNDERSVVEREQEVLCAA